MTTFCKLSDLITESDVEQKLIFPILTSDYPIGLGYSNSDFRTKPDIRKISIDKGSGNRKLYYPDYIVIIQGIPALIIEAKKPGEDLEEALREARLYAHELNSQFLSGINPCSRVIVTDGKTLISSGWDSVQPDIIVPFDNINVTSEQYTSFIKLHCKDSILNFCSNLQKKIRGKRNFTQPNSIIGGKNIRDQEFPENDFGQKLAFEYRHIFNPITEEDRKDIVKNAYVQSSLREKHLDPINKIILAARPSSMIDAHQIEDITKPKEIHEKFKDKESLKNELLLLIGNVGSGKSTFVDFLKEVSLPNTVKESTLWISVDLNDAPNSKELVYKWTQEKIIEGFKLSEEKTDFDDIDILRKLYSVEIKKLEKGPAALFEKDSEEYNKIIAKKLYDLQNDLEITTRAYARYLCGERSKLLVLVLDNCDKRNKDDQLLVFDLAKWLKRELKALVFLPMRDTTYDNHKTEPPLDTVVKDLIFRIDPPTLAKVLYRRIEYAIVDQKKEFSLTLKNGVVVKYKQPEQKVYLACMLKSLFANDPFFRQLINGIAGRNIRLGIEIFLEFCKSGHINEEEILKIRASQGDYVLPNYLITRVLLRGNRRYYSDESSHIKNLFASFPEEEQLPDPYIRVSILQWLKNRSKKYGSSNMLGYHKISDLIKCLTPLGHSENRIIKEIGSLIKAHCILTETQEGELSGKESIDEILGSSIVADDGLISLAPAGYIHLQLLNNLDYLSSCSEDVWYEELQIAQKIAERLTGKSGSGYLSLGSNINNASDLVNYLVRYKEKFVSNPSSYLNEEAYEELINLGESLSVIERSKKDNIQEVNIEVLKNDFPPGMVVDGQIVSIKPYGVFVEFGLNAIGFIHSSAFSNQKNLIQGILLENLENGQWLKVEIIKFSDKHSKFELRLSF